MHTLFVSKTAPFDMTIVVKSSDTKVFVLLLFYCETGTGNNKRLVNVNKIALAIGYELAIIYLHFMHSLDVILPALL